MNGLLALIRGIGRVAPPDPGNTANPPGQPYVQTGDYQFIQPFAFQGNGHNITDIFSIPPAFQDVGEYAVNITDASGNTGGGVYNGDQTNVSNEADLFYDTNTGIYYNLG